MVKANNSFGKMEFIIQKNGLIVRDSLVNKYLVVCMSVEAECSFDKIRPLAISNVIKIGCGQFEKSKPAG